MTTHGLESLATEFQNRNPPVAMRLIALAMASASEENPTKLDLNG